MSRMRRFFAWLNDDNDFDGPPAAVKWIVFVCLMLAGSCTAATTTQYLAFERPAQRAVIACQMRGMDAARPDFSREVFCLPRYRGADSLNATVEAK